MSLVKKIHKLVYNLIRAYRWNRISGLLDKNSKTVLDVGCSDLYFYSKLKKRGYLCTPIDIQPKNRGVIKQNIEKIRFKNKSFDIVLCLEVLEHTKNPVKALKELKRVAKNQIIISVPNEPFFSLFRFFAWEKEHLWAITPKILRAYLGNPILEKKIFLKRYYIGVWKP